MICKLKQENLRCIYENDDILVMHFVMTFPNGTRDAVMYVATKRDGKIVRIETGSTPLSAEWFTTPKISDENTKPN